MIQLDLSDHRPIYEQIKDKFIQLIVSGVLNPHDKMPSVRELAGILTINPNTIQRAYRDLEAEGYIYSQQSKGSFVSPREVVSDTVDKEKITDELEELVRRASYIGIEQGTVLGIIEKIYKEKNR